MKFRLLIVLALVLISGFLYYELVGFAVLEREEVFVVSVIDGDTFATQEGAKIRLKGINCPEINMLYYKDARDFLEFLILNKTVEIEIFDRDKYGRFLAYVFVGSLNVNKELVEKGYAHIYYYGEDRYYGEFVEAEKDARDKAYGIWKKSSNYWCLQLIEFSYKEPEKLILKNNCNDFNILIKDDATHIYNEVLNKGLFEKSFSHIFNDDGDSVYIYDDRGLVFFKRY
jgi:endonuclease YncB( thermonuclease family)